MPPARGAHRATTQTRRRKRTGRRTRTRTLMTTISTITSGRTTTTTAAGEGAAVVSPFEGAAVRVDHRDYESTSEHDAAKGRRAAPGAAGAPPELTAENVDAVLDEVRPYLISDGGNVSVRSVGDGEGGGGRGDNGAAGRAEERVPRPRGGVRILRQLDGDDEDGN